jgi:hypothetical protein
MHSQQARSNIRTAMKKTAQSGSKTAFIVKIVPIITDVKDFIWLSGEKSTRHTWPLFQWNAKKRSENAGEGRP